MKFPKNMEEFENVLLNAFRAGITAGYSISQEEDLCKNELDAAIKFCEDFGMVNYGRFVYPPQFAVPDGYTYGNSESKSPSESNECITLFVKYREPIHINGFVVETDEITFGSQEELNKYINGECAYDILDNSVKKRDVELLLYATDESGNIVWDSNENQVVEEGQQIKNNAFKRKCR